MKKSLAIVLGLISATTFADEPTKVEQPLLKPQQEMQAMLKLGVYDVSNKVIREINNRKYSIKQAKNLSLCWTAFNMPFIDKNNVIEVFQSPKKSKFSDKTGSVVTSKDRKTHTITSSLPSYNNEFITKCWRFEKNDPLGTYTLEVRVNDIIFPAQPFELVK